MPPLRPDIEATEPNISSPNSSKPSINDTQFTENAGSRRASTARKASVAALLRNPLAGMSEEEVIRDVDAWVVEKGLAEYQEVFRKGALIARVGQREDGFEYVGQLNEEEKGLLRHEITHRWDHPFMLYFLVVLCAGSAIVQGMDQTAVNGAQVLPSLPVPLFVWRGVMMDGWMLSLPAALLLRRIQHHKRMAARPPQRRAVPLLRPHRLLDQRAAELLHRPPRHHLRLVLYFLRDWLLDGCRRVVSPPIPLTYSPTPYTNASRCVQMVQSPDRPLRPGLRRRRQVEHHACLRRGVGAQDDPRRAHHDVADVDGVWDYDWLCCVCRV